MDIIGVICEYNPFHNGHLYHLNKIKKQFPNSLIILVLNGYFLERGEISILSKEEKTKMALQNNIDLVVELPYVFGCQSSDIFANTSMQILNYLKVQKIIFGSESNDTELLTKIAQEQLKENFNDKVKANLDLGLNYPSALNKAIGTNLFTPNDLLGVSYIKSIIQNKYKIEALTILRTNDYHDTKSNEHIISASNIRKKISQNIDVSNFTPYYKNFNKINEELLFKLLQYKILTEHDLSKYLSVDEGLENKLIKEINNSHSVDELISNIKSKRYTYNRLKRMLMHILLGLTKEDMKQLKLEYIKVLGFNNKGQNYLKNLKSNILIKRKISNKFLAQQYELKASLIYDLLTSDNTINYELNNKPTKNID